MSDEFPAVEFGKVDVDDVEDVAAECKISAMPTFQFYRDGKIVKEIQGADEAGLRAALTVL
jgi:thioredoxin 1